MSGLQHVRTSHSPPHVKRSATAKAARSAPGASRKISSKAGKPRKQKHIEEDEARGLDWDEGDDHMATTFLQYCTMCDKQILVPNSNILYCSEHCRRLDAMPITSPGRIPSYSTPRPYQPPNDSSYGTSVPRYVPAMRPTPRESIDPRIPPKHHVGIKSDLDPTEWKPSEPLGLDEDHGIKVKKSPVPADLSARPKANGPSDASRYLTKFHQSSSSLNHGASTENQGKAALPPLSRASTATASSTSSSASSLSSSPYSMVSPPPISSVATTSITTDAIISGAAFDVMNFEGKGELKYEKKKVKSSPRKSVASGSLKKLLDKQHGLIS